MTREPITPEEFVRRLKELGLCALEDPRRLDPKDLEMLIEGLERMEKGRSCEKRS